MAVNLTQEQFEALLNRLAPQQNNQGLAMAVGPMAPCQLGIDKTKRLRRYNDWLKEAESKMEVMGVTESRKKTALIKSWAGSELINFWETEARVVFRDVAAVGNAPAITADTYEEILNKTKAEILKHVNRDRSIIDLFNSKQGESTWMEFIRELEVAADLCRL